MRVCVVGTDSRGHGTKADVALLGQANPGGHEVQEIAEPVENLPSAQGCGATFLEAHEYPGGHCTHADMPLLIA